MRIKKYGFFCISIAIVIGILMVGAYAFRETADKEKDESFTQEDGYKYIADSLGYKEDVSYTGVEESLGFYEYESKARFYSIDPISGEVMTLISKDLTPLFENISADPLENAKAFIERIDEAFFEIGAREEMTKLENGEISVVFESLAAEDIGNGRIAGVRMDANGNIISLAFSISSAKAEENAQMIVEGTITVDKAIKIATADAREEIERFETSMNDAAKMFYADEHQPNSIVTADSGREYDVTKPDTEFEVYFNSADAEASSRLSFWRGRQVWIVEIDHIETSDNTELQYCCYIDAVTGEIVFSDRSM